MVQVALDQRGKRIGARRCGLVASLVALGEHQDRRVAAQSHPSLELIISGGAPLGAALQEAVAARFPHAAVGQGYGMTETSVAISGPDR